MKNFTASILPAMFSAAILLPVQNALADQKMQPGEWEVTTTAEMAGMKMPPRTVKSCVKPEQAGSPETAIPQQKDCEISTHTVTGNKVSWTMKCTGVSKMEGSGEMIYGPGTYEGTMRFKMDDPKMAQMGEMVTHLAGRRVGDCS